MDTVDPKILDSMDKALAAAFKTRMQAKSGKKKKLGNTSFSYAKKRILIERYFVHFGEFSNVYNGDRSSNTTQSNFSYKNA